MVPFIHIPALHVGPLPIHPFGLLVVTGVLVGTSITIRRGDKLGYDTSELNSFITWMLLCGFVISHVLDEIFYHWDEVVSHPLILVMLWRGISSFGGFVGMVVGMLLWRNVLALDGPGIHLLGVRLVRLPRFRWRSRPLPILPFANLILSVFPIGWMFGRAGCASVHDHPGGDASLHNLVAVAYPACFPCRVVSDRVVGLAAGESVSRIGFIEFIHGSRPRFDLGFLELLFTVALAACFVLMWRRRPPVGTYVAATCIAYAPVRFWMDFVRVSESQGGDTRYAGLTPAQYGCLALFAFGLYMVNRVRLIRRSGVDVAADVRAPAPSPSADAVRA